MPPTSKSTGLESSPPLKGPTYGWRKHIVPDEGNALQVARHEAHRHLDALWKTKPVGIRARYRTGVYAWLRRLTGMSQEECHISRFDRGMCEAVVMLCQQAEAGLIEKPRLPNGVKRHRDARRV